MQLATAPAKPTVAGRKPVSSGHVTAAEALEELNRVLQSADFPASPRNRRFLCHVVTRATESPSASDAYISAREIAVTVFGRADDFSTTLDPVVRIEAGKLRRDLETYYLKSGGRNPVRIEIPCGGYAAFFSRRKPTEKRTGPAVTATGDLATDAKAELARVLASPDFPSVARNRTFLAYIVGKELDGRSEEVSATLLAQQVFGRGGDFDPNKDPIVRIEAAKLRRDLETYYLKSGRHNPLQISVPRGAYRAVFSYKKAGDLPAGRNGSE